MKRRKFIKQSGKIGLGCMMGSSILHGCSTVKYIPHTIKDNKIIVSKFDFGTDLTYVLVKNEKLPAPIFLLRQNEQKYSAVLMECTHKSCEVQPFGEQLHCPCHGSEFTNTGIVLEGPAETDLQKFRVSSDEHNIYIS
jgi:cytochrome b6-f complex iron-sulfur subunit